jgi:hypothetical protein
MEYYTQINVAARYLPPEYIKAHVEPGYMDEPESPDEQVEIDVVVTFEPGYCDNRRGYRGPFARDESEACTVEEVALDGGWGHVFPDEALDMDALVRACDEHLTELANDYDPC